MVHKLRFLGVGQLMRLAVSVHRHGLTMLALLHSVRQAKGFIEDETERLSYAALYSQSVALANYLHEKLGIGQKSKVAIAGSNSAAFVKALFAASGLGADVFLISPNREKGYYSRFLASHNIDIILGNAPLAPLLPSAIPFFDYEAAITGSSVIIHAVARKKGSLVVLSGGSTGQPKAEKRKISAIKYLNPLVDIITKLELKQNRSVLVGVPLFHGYGLAALALSVFMGKEIYLSKKFDAAKTLGILKDKDPDCWIAVPLMVQKVLAVSQNLPVRSIICGGDVLPPSVVNTVHAGMHARIYNLYGTSETGVCAIATDADLRRYPNTIGKAIKGVKTKSANAKNGTGALLVKCAWSSDGKRNGFVPTGDLVTQNAGGYYFFKGRVDDMMVIGGENVYPIEIENAVYKNPGVKWVKAKGITQNHTTKVHIDVVLREDAVYDEAEFLIGLTDEMPGYMMPKSITILPEEPVAKLM